MKKEYYSFHFVQKDSDMPSDLKLSFSFDRSYVIYGEMNNHDKNLNYKGFMVFIKNQNHCTNAIEAFKYNRSQYLIILGIISFITGYSVHTTSETDTLYAPINFPEDKQGNKLILGDKDYTKDLNTLLSKIQAKNSLLPTILDKLRRASHHIESSYGTLMYIDDALLCLVQALEILFNEYDDKMKSIVKLQINNFLKSFFTTTLFYKTDRGGLIKESEKNILKFLYNGKVGLEAKIKFMLNCHRMLDENISYFIDNIVKARNKIAHGNKLNADNIYTYSNFFSSSDYTLKDTMILMELVYCLISKHYGLTRWNNQIKFVQSDVPLSYDTFNCILTGQLDIEDVDGKIIISETDYHIKWSTVIFYYTRLKDYDRKKIEKVFKKFLLNNVFDPQNCKEIFYLSLVLSEAYDLEIREKARGNIKLAIEHDCNLIYTYDSSIYIKPNDLKYEWFEEYIRVYYESTKQD